MSGNVSTRMDSLADVWTQCVQRFPRRTGLRAGGTELSYAELDARVRSLAGALVRRFELRKGDRVGILMENSAEFFLAYWATHLAGCAVAAISPRLAAREAGYVIRATSPRVLFHDDDLAPPAEGGPIERAVPREELASLAGQTIDAPPDPETGSDAPAVLAHTSGTTGEPKIAEVSHAELFFNLRTAIFAHSLRHEDAILSGVPMFHCTPLYSLMPASAYLGATLVITAETKATRLARIAREEGATVWFGVPTVFHQVAAAPDLEPGTLDGVRLLAYAGSPMRPATIRRLRERWAHLELHNFFGLTETISMTHVLPSVDALERGSSIGKLLPEVYARVVGPDGEDVAPGAAGELCFHRSNVIRNYWGKPGLLEKSFTGDWFRTGDLARRDEDGYFYLEGRSKDMIIVSGENVYATEVEAVLAECPGVSEVAVVGVAAEGVRASLGELVKAVIVPEPGTEVKELTIKRFAFERLTSYKVPQIVEFRDELPRNPAGKVLKEELK